MADLKVPEIVELLRKALDMEQQNRVIIIAKDEDQANIAHEIGTIALHPQVRTVECSNCVIYLADPEGENV